MSMDKNHWCATTQTECPVLSQQSVVLSKDDCELLLEKMRGVISQTQGCICSDCQKLAPLILKLRDAVEGKRQ